MLDVVKTTEETRDLSQTNLTASNAALTAKAGPITDLAQKSSKESSTARSSAQKKPRNPIIVTMLIMQAVTDALKGIADQTKKTSKLQKRIWRLYSEQQSANYTEGKNCQTRAMGGNSVKVVSQILASQLESVKIPGTQGMEAATVVSAVGTMAGGYAETVFPQEQNRVQIKDAEFQHKVGSSSAEFQNHSQQVGADKQAADSAREKGLQIGQMMARMITAQPA